MRKYAKPMNLKENMRQVKSFVLGSVFLLVFASSSMGETLDFLVRENDVVRGDPRAPVTLLEYSDFTCGFCEKFFHETFPLLLSKYVETGKVRFVYRDFLRSPVGPALNAAQATRCAAEQEAYWPMHDRLFNSGMQFNVENLGNYAKELGLDASQFATCIEENRHVAAIYKDRLEAGSLGIRGTPGFVLFLTELP